MLSIFKRWRESRAEDKRLIAEFKAANPKLTQPYYCPFSGRRIEWRFWIVKPKEFDTKTGICLGKKSVAASQYTTVDSSCGVWDCKHWYDHKDKLIVSSGFPYNLKLLKE